MDAERKKDAEALILRASRACRLPTSRHDVRAALDDAHHGALFAEWASLRLGNDTLLTADELQIYTELDKSGRVDHLADAHDLAQVQAVTAEDLALAVEQLRRSTDMINKQAETLRKQRDALSRLVKKQADDATRRQEMERVQKRKTEVERAQLTREVDKISQDIHLRLADLEQQAEGPSLRDQVGAVLAQDDRLLSGLQKLGWELDRPDPDEGPALEELREMCTRLVQTTVGSVRTRLDTIYLDTLAAAEESDAAAVQPATREDVAALQEEVESLYAEIQSVAQMSIERAYLEPALVSIAAKSGQSVGRTILSLNYINESLTYLQHKTAKLHTHIEAHNSHAAAARLMTATANAELAVAVDASTAHLPPPHSKEAPPISPVRTRTAPAPGQESALKTLLSRLAVSLPSEEESTPQERLASLSRTVADRSGKCQLVATGAQDSLEALTRAHLTDAKLAMQLLRDSLLAESPLADMHLVDPEIDRSVVVLGAEVDRVRGALRALEARAAGAGGGAKGRVFVERWAS